MCIYLSPSAYLTQRWASPREVMIYHGFIKSTKEKAKVLISACKPPQVDVFVSSYSLDWYVFVLKVLNWDMPKRRPIHEVFNF